MRGRGRSAPPALQLVTHAVATFERTESGSSDIAHANGQLQKALEESRQNCRILFGASAGAVSLPSGEGPDTPDETLSEAEKLSEASDSDWAMETYRQERMAEIMARGGPQTPSRGAPSQPDTPQSSSLAGGSELASPRDPTLLRDGGKGKDGRGKSSAGSNWPANVSGRLALSPDQLELCKRLDQELRHYYSMFHYTQIDRQYIIRAVYCKKTFDRALKMCLELCTDVLDRYGLAQLKADDVAPVTSRNAICRIEPSACSLCLDGSSLFYIVVQRLMQPTVVDVTDFVRAMLFLIERTRAFEGRLAFIIDLAGVQIKPQNAKQLTQIAQSIRLAVEGKYPAQVSRLLLVPGSQLSGPFTSMMMKGIMMKALSSRWRERTEVYRTLDGVVSNVAALRRAVYTSLNY